MICLGGSLRSDRCAGDGDSPLGLGLGQGLFDGLIILSRRICAACIYTEGVVPLRSRRISGDPCPYWRHLLGVRWIALDEVGFGARRGILILSFPRSVLASGCSMEDDVDDVALSFSDVMRNIFGTLDPLLGCMCNRG